MDEPILAEVLRGRVNPDHILQRMRDDYESDWPNRLIRALADAPLVDEAVIQPTQGVSRTAQFLSAASHGLTMEMTADLYGVSPETVKTTLRRARAKLGAKSTTHAVARALRLGLIK